MKLQPTLDPQEQHALLMRGTEEVLPETELLERLRRCAREGRPLRVKQGFDPTAPDIHLGHTVGLRKLRQFQDLGHQVVLIVGDYTGMVGDPSGRSKTRPQLSEGEVEAHARTYLEQFYRVLERDPAPPRLPVEVHRNGEWFSRMTFMDVLRLAAQYTVARILERDDFAKRFQDSQPISLHELFYPLMQGYDSVAIRADIELGGTEQKFNLLVGRVFQELHGQAPQIVMTVPILPGLDGVQRMSKSLGNYIGVTDAPADMFGKVMSIPDTLMPLFWRLVTDADDGELARVEAELRDPAENPMGVKKRLGGRLVTMYHGAAAAERARRDFEAQFSRHEIPEDLPVWQVSGGGEMGIKDLLVRSGLAKSGSEAWRAVDQGAVSIDQVKIGDRGYRQRLGAPFVLRLGRRMIRVEPLAH
ncbi:MAG: tyrosine--tRNA ligase [Candidatus Eisenbacteria bacterium]|nr:tyrosine--tRNA ligase [Candidatus Eisenbacteria bacterium]